MGKGKRELDEEPEDGGLGLFGKKKDTEPEGKKKMGKGKRILIDELDMN
jgi:hypothetical protein